MIKIECPAAATRGVWSESYQRGDYAKAKACVLAWGGEPDKKATSFVCVGEGREGRSGGVLQMATVARAYTGLAWVVNPVRESYAVDVNKDAGRSGVEAPPFGKTLRVRGLHDVRKAPARGRGAAERRRSRRLNNRGHPVREPRARVWKTHLPIHRPDAAAVLPRAARRRRGRVFKLNYTPQRRYDFDSALLLEDLDHVLVRAQQR